MALAYSPPGVTVEESVTPSVNPLLAAPANVCIVGPAQGYVQTTDLVTLANQDAVRLPRLPQGATLVSPLVSVVNINDVNKDYVSGTDYVVNYTSNVDEVQTITIANATGGTFTLSFNGQITANIAYNASAATVESALEALANLDTADVAVSGSTGGPYTITFSGVYTNSNVPELVANGAGLTGSSPTITAHTTTEGGVVGTIRRVGGGGIADGETVQVVYRYVPANYYSATRLEELSSVEELYGPALDSSGNISSLVSFAASVAFENGARDLVIAPLYKLTTPTDPNSVRLAPDSTDVQSATTWAQTLVGLREIEDINVIVPSIGQSVSGLTDAEQAAIINAVQDHVKYMADQQQYIVAVVGEDSSLSSTVASAATLRSHVASLRSRHGGTVNERIVYSNSSKAGRLNPVTGQKFYVGGQYLAAAFAGMLASRAVSSTLTREVISGFTDIADYPARSKADKNLDASVGLCVFETNKAGNVWVRHAISTDTTATQRREVSVVRAKDRMVESIRDTLDTQVIGKVIADGKAPVIVAAAVQNVLEQLKIVGDLVNYRDIQARTLAIEPTTVEVRFSYLPAFPLNYINIKFSIDLTDQTVEVA